METVAPVLSVAVFFYHNCKLSVNKLTACKYFDFTYDAGEALKITQRVKNVIVEPDDYIIRSDVTDGNYWLLDL